MSANTDPAVWFPSVRTGTGTDVFTERLVDGLRALGMRADITWLPLRAEYAPWSVRVPAPPAWANVVHVNTWLHSRFLPRNLPIVATIHHSVHAPDARAYKTALRAAYHRCWIAPNERRLLRRADKAVAVSRFAAEVACRWLLDREYEVIHNGVDTSIFRPRIRQRLDGEPFRLLYVGRWAALKGVDMLPLIMEELGSEFELRYTGAPEPQTRAMPPNMRDIGRLEGDAAVVAAMHVADALLFPSRSEGFGLVVAEAMACGLPVIATRGSSLKEVVEDGLTGFLCAQDDVAAYVEAVRELKRDLERARTMSIAARARAEALFAIRHMLDAYVPLYRECLPHLVSDTPKWS